MAGNMKNLFISLLGSFKATLNKQPITQFRTKSVQALLIYLVCEAERPSQREHLMDLLWPGMPQASAQTNMRQTLYRLRNIIPEVKGKEGVTAVPFLISNRQTIQINPDADYFADVLAFTSLINSNPEQAIELYRGDFLADFYLPDSESFEVWAASRREAYRRQVLQVLEEVTAVSIQNANYDQAIQLAQRQLEIDNLRESSHRQLLEAWARNGRRQEALSHYNTLRQL
jgi:DNA-binding SARP family transcriptional activator